MFEEFKKAMAQEFEITNFDLMSYYLGIKVKQMMEGIYIGQERLCSKNSRWMIASQ